MKSTTALGFVAFAAIPIGLLLWNIKELNTSYVKRSVHIDISKLERALGIRMPSWQDSLKQTMRLAALLNNN